MTCAGESELSEWRASGGRKSLAASAVSPGVGNVFWFANLARFSIPHLIPLPPFPPSWEARRDAAGPTTIQEIHRRAEREQMEQQRRDAAGRRSGGGRGGGGPAPKGPLAVRGARAGRLLRSTFVWCGWKVVVSRRGLAEGRRTGALLVR